MCFKRLLILLAFMVCILPFTNLKAQVHRADSLAAHLSEMKDDTNKVKRLCLIWRLYDDASVMDKAMEYAQQAYKLAVKLNEPDHIANAANCVGNTAIDEGAYPMAMEYYMKELKAAEESKSKYYMSNATCNIGLVYFYQNDVKQALDYYKKALVIDEEIHDSSNITAATTDIGTAYYQLKDYSNAKKYFLQSLTIDRKKRFLSAISGDLENIGDIYLSQKRYDSALSYLNESLKISTKMNFPLQIIADKLGLGEIYIEMKNYDRAEKIITEALNFSDSIHSLDNIKSACEDLSKIYSEKSDWQKAYTFFQRYMTTKDSLVNEAKSKEIGKLEAKTGYDKQLALQKAEIDKKEAIAAAENKHQKILIALVSTVALAVAIMVLVILRSLRITRKQKEIIEVQTKQVEEKKFLVEEKNKAILDSITYAKQLQDAILPPMNTIQKYLPESFVLYKPKDIVAGDFYWLEKKGDTVFVAAADCTGHGVPGAMVSVVCSNALNRSVKEFGITEPGKILDKTRELVLETFEKSEGNIQDGMDISLCAINMTTKEMQWAGAYNALWYIQNGEMKEIAGDKQPIGKTDNPKPFTTRTIKISGAIYLFTDGYADQFGGEKGKKYKYKQLQQLLEKNAAASMKKQGNTLESEFEKWKGMLDQTDDVCVIGIRI